MNIESYDDDISKLIVDINKTNWDDEWFDPVKAHICCRLSQLSYLAIPNDMNLKKEEDLKLFQMTDSNV